MANSNPYFITTAIPYVNSTPHIGFGMELVLADAFARHAGQRGKDVRFQTGTDENSLKNVRAAEKEGIATAELVRRNAQAFEDLRDALDLSWRSFVRTSADSFHAAGAQTLWRACDAAGDVYARKYSGLYCVGCEQYYAEDDLVDGLCPEHRTAPELIEEENLFFRLSKYQEVLETLIESGELRVEPEHYRNETLSFIRSGLEDFSISRSHERAHGWGIQVPGSPGQVMYVWFDALGNYVSGLGYAEGADDYQRYWAGEGERVHVIGKGVLRFHAVYWPAMLLSAGLPLPTQILVHGYLTAGGAKMSKSLGNVIGPRQLAEEFGSDTLRYFLCRHYRFGHDGDFSRELVAVAHNKELADLLGNLLQRTVAMAGRYYEGKVPSPGEHQASSVSEIAARLVDEVRGSFDRSRPDEAVRKIWELVAEANRYLVELAPWKLAKRRDEPGVEAQLARCLYNTLETLRLIAFYIAPFMPKSAAKIEAQLGLGDRAVQTWADATRWGGLQPDTALVPGEILFAKIELED